MYTNDNWEYVKIEYTNGTYNIYKKVGDIWTWDNGYQLLRDAIAYADYLEDALQDDRLDEPQMKGIC